MTLSSARSIEGRPFLTALGHSFSSFSSTPTPYSNLEGNQRRRLVHCDGVSGDGSSLHCMTEGREGLPIGREGRLERSSAMGAIIHFSLPWMYIRASRTG